GPADRGRGVADVTDRSDQPHGLVLAVVGLAGALDRGVEVLDELIRLVLLVEDLAEDGRLALELLVEVVIFARVAVEDGRGRHRGWARGPGGGGARGCGCDWRRRPGGGWRRSVCRWCPRPRWCCRSLRRWPGSHRSRTSRSPPG